MSDAASPAQPPGADADGKRTVAANPGAHAAPSAGRPQPPARGAGVVLTALAVVLLAVGIAWVWSQQQQFAESADVAALREQLRTLQARLGQIEQRPAAPAAPAIDLRPLEARLAALEQRPAVASAAPDAASSGAWAERLAALDQRVVQAERAASRTVRIARLQRAVAALEAGQALGDIPGAPAALARFAAAAPPTEQALRLAFPAHAERARAASQGAGGEPGVGDQGVGDRIWHRVLGLVTVRAGDTVLVGSAASIVLGQASARLGAGDLAGTVAVLDTLDPAAGAAIAGWRDAASTLLAARAALTAMLAE